ncbi:hypothetical protein OROMI_004924 [Orobanche minor]
MSNALVRPVKLGFENPLTNNKFQWILGARTAILATDEDSLISSELTPTVTQCSHFRDFLGSRTLISTTAIIIDSHTPITLTAKGKQNTLHEYAAVDELYLLLYDDAIYSRARSFHIFILKPFIITFWNDAAPDDVYNLLDCVKDRHIIAALNFNVTDYHTYFRHKREIDDIQQRGDVFKRAQSNFSIDPETFTSVQMFLTAEERDRSILCVRGKLLSTNQNFVYPCCTKCHRLTTAEYGCLFECHSCHEIKNVIPRYRFSLLVYDETGEMEVTGFGNEGEKIMHMPAADFLDIYSKARLLTIDSINSNLHQLELKMKVQSKVFNKQDGTSTLSHTMQSLECHQLPSSTISTNQLPSSTISTDDIPGASSAGKADISELPQPDTGPLISPAKEH